jgi:hypothetical protein
MSEQPEPERKTLPMSLMLDVLVTLPKPEREAMLREWFEQRAEELRAKKETKA